MLSLCPFSLPLSIFSLLQDSWISLCTIAPWEPQFLVFSGETREIVASLPSSVLLITLFMLLNSLFQEFLDITTQKPFIRLIEIDSHRIEENSEAKYLTSTFIYTPDAPTTCTQSHTNTPTHPSLIFWVCNLR